jgi:hypothetical protein
MTYTGQCSACIGACQTEEALTTTVTYDSFGNPQSGINLALGHYDGVTFVAVPQLAVQVSCSSGGDCLPGMAGVYLAGGRSKSNKRPILSCRLHRLACR